MAIAEIRGHEHQEPLGLFALGFFDSATALFERAVDGHGLINFAFYPAAYCLRHGLELLTKQMSLYVAYEMQDPGLRYKHGHSLTKTWERIRAVLLEATSESMASTTEWAVQDIAHHFDVVDGLIGELDALDKGGASLRYPDDLPFTFDLVNLKDWAAMSEAALHAAQTLLGFTEEKATRVAERRGDLPYDFDGLVSRLPPKPVAPGDGG